MENSRIHATPQPEAIQEASDMGWKININTRSADDGKGNVVRFERTGTTWAASPPNDDAMAVWEGELQRGAEMLKAVGEMLYGVEWKTPFADDFDISRDTPRLWLSGKTPFTMDHPIWPDIQKMLQERRDTADQLLKQIGQAVKKADVPVSKRFARNRD